VDKQSIFVSGVSHTDKDFKEGKLLPDGLVITNEVNTALNSAFMKSVTVRSILPRPDEKICFCMGAMGDDPYCPCVMRQKGLPVSEVKGAHVDIIQHSGG
jgi:hypothetical protein